MKCSWLDVFILQSYIMNSSKNFSKSSSNFAESMDDIPSENNVVTLFPEDLVRISEQIIKIKEKL